MIYFTLKRWWWRKWSPFVRVGWLVSSNARTGMGRALGLGLIVAALILKARPAQKLYSAKIPEGESIAIRVVQRGQTIVAG
jgi:hypothetical protein